MVAYGGQSTGGMVRTQGSAVAGIVDSSGFFVGAGRAHMWSVDGEIKFDTSKGQKIFGIKLRTKEETCRDILAQIKDEWLP